MVDFQAGETGPERVVDALRHARVLVPLIAELGEAGANDEGVTVDKSAELSIVTVQGPDGRPVLPVFTSTDAMRAWNPDARPIPIGMRRVAAAVVEEGTDLVIVDPGSATEFGIRRPASWAIVRDEPWTPAWSNEEVATAVAAGVSAEPLVEAIEMGPGGLGVGLEGPELLVTLRVPDSAPRDELAALATRAQTAWQEDESIAVGVDSMTLRLAPVSASPLAAESAPGAPGEPGESGESVEPHASSSTRRVRDLFRRRPRDGA
nr:SseB family protein [Pseudoclavibacter chungangensis]